MKIDLFPVSIYHYRVEDPESLKEEVINFYEESKDPFIGYSGTPPEGWNCDLFTTYGTTRFSVENLKLHLETPINNFMEEIDSKGTCNFTEAWVNCYEHKNWQERHAHLPGHWSGAYYAVLDPKEHQGTTFHDPNDDMRSWVGNKFSSVTAQVQEGDLLIFPSWLYHSALMNESEKLRATISFNLFIEEEFKVGE